MALATTTGVVEIRTTGSDANGGGFDTASGGTDYSQQNSAQLSVTDGVTVGSTTVTSVTGGFTTAMIGNWINIGGDGVYQITARASTNSITVDRNTGTAIGQTMKVGGAFASPGYAAGIINNGNTVYVKNTATYNISSASTNVSNGVISTNTRSIGGSSSGIQRWIGYTTTRGDNGRAVLQASTGSLTFITNYSWQSFENFELDGNAQTSVLGVNVAWAYPVFKNIYVHACTSGGFSSAGTGSGVTYYNCRASGCGKVASAQFETSSLTAGSGANYVYKCRSDGCTNGTGFWIGGSTIASKCISDANNSAGFLIDNLGQVSDSIAYNNVHGYDCYNTKLQTFSNCIAVSNSGTGFRVNGGTGFLFGSAYYNNGTAVDGPVELGSISLSGNPFTAAGSGDFSLNNTGGAGASLRAANYFSNMFGTTDYADIGPVQHQDSGGGGSTQHSATFGG